MQPVLSVNRVTGGSHDQAYPHQARHCRGGSPDIPATCVEHDSLWPHGQVRGTRISRAIPRLGAEQLRQRCRIACRWWHGTHMKLPLELGERHHQYRQMKFSVETAQSNRNAVAHEDSYERPLVERPRGRIPVRQQCRALIQEHRRYTRMHPRLKPAGWTGQVSGRSLVSPRATASRARK